MLRAVGLTRYHVRVIAEDVATLAERRARPLAALHKPKYLCAGHRYFWLWSRLHGELDNVLGRDNYRRHSPSLW